MKKSQNKSKVFRHSSDIGADAPQGLPCKHITSYFSAFQVIFLIRPPGLPGKKADRRIWQVKSIVRRLAFVCSLSEQCHTSCQFVDLLFRTADGNPKIIQFRF